MLLVALISPVVPEAAVPTPNESNCTSLVVVSSSAVLASAAVVAPVPPLFLRGFEAVALGLGASPG